MRLALDILEGQNFARKNHHGERCSWKRCGSAMVSAIFSPPLPVDRKATFAEPPDSTGIGEGVIFDRLSNWPNGRPLTPLVRGTTPPLVGSGLEIVLTRSGGADPLRREGPRNRPHRNRGVPHPLVGEGPEGIVRQDVWS